MIYKFTENKLSRVKWVLFSSLRLLVMIFLNQNKRQKQKLADIHKKRYIYQIAFAATKENKTGE